mmetsp:Transcript_18802/g.35274  ORF Transcript_18802/g.35274 Transcript_18802/m.35274 type:complete len:199 (-) Transcript_18802:10-606(-)
MAPNCSVTFQPVADDLDTEPLAPEELEGLAPEQFTDKTTPATRTSYASVSTELCELIDSYSSVDSLESSMSTRSGAKRLVRKRRNEAKLQEFLRRNSFSEDVNEPRMARPSCFSIMSKMWSSPEDIYPIHLAAALGNADLLRLLLKAGADPKQRTSKGWSAVELAQEQNRKGSHEHIIDLLKGRVKAMAMREFLSLTE